ncbi:MAG: hypothetical protein H6937_13290 [Burkholderiales bacterium]|nr:hypothetical protein [Burkholderiales bacterium]
MATNKVMVFFNCIVDRTGGSHVSPHGCGRFYLWKLSLRQNNFHNPRQTITGEQSGGKEHGSTLTATITKLVCIYGLPFSMQDSANMMAKDLLSGLSFQLSLLMFLRY